ncbi:probable cytochrome P450 6a20 isoform X2 [Solenopsis invicta]|nr:probable cytochrome P450 6a20 isoform X2 [Solenopsis invicta]
MYAFFKPNLVITDLDLMRTVLTKEFKSFHDRGLYSNETIDPAINRLFLNGQNWLHYRAKMTPTFTAGKMKQMFVIVKQCGEELAKHLEKNAQMRDTVEMRDILTRYASDSIMSAAFGVNTNCIQKPNEYQSTSQEKTTFDSNFFKRILIRFAPQVTDFFSLPFSVQAVTNFYMNLFRDTVEYRKANGIVRPDLMSLLIEHVEKDFDPKVTVKKLTTAEATAQVSFALFLAGFETSSTTATFALFELAQHQDMQEKVCKEIDEILAKHGDLTYDALNDMTYFHKVINETLRKYPPLPFLHRVCTEEIDLPTTNIHVPKGTLITVPLLGVHRDPSIYPDPDKFDPERFNADKVKERHPYAFMPFGDGPRNCVGSRFGYLQAKIALVSLLSKYKFKLHSQTPVPIVFSEKSAILVAKNGVHLIIEPR